MKILRANTPELVRAAVEILRRGGVVAHPTDTVWGLAADASHPAAVAKVHAIKGSDSTKPLLIIIPTKAYLREIAIIPASARRLIAAFWPGPLALVLKAKSPDFATLVAPFGKGGRDASGGEGGFSIGVRYPAHDLSLALARGLGRPITTTSANLTGEPTGRSADELHAIFSQRKNQPDLIIDPAPHAGQPFIAPLSSVPSTIVDCSGGAVRVVREGAIPAVKIQTFLSHRS